MTYCIYVHRNKVNGKVYVGKAAEVYRADGGLVRWGFRGVNYHSTSTIKKAFAKYGWENFEHEVIETGLSEEEAYQKEQEYIAKYKCIAPYGYNLCLGGRGSGGHVCTEDTNRSNSEWHRGRSLSEEHKQHIRESCRHPAVRAKMSKSHKGVPLGTVHKEHMLAAVKKAMTKPEYKEHLRAAMKGKAPKPEVIQAASIAKYKKVRCIETGIVYESQIAAEKATGVSHKGISACVRGKRKSVAGLHWEFV